MSKVLLHLVFDVNLRCEVLLLDRFFILTDILRLLGCRGVHLHCRTHGRVGRCGVRGVRGGQVQVGDGGMGVLSVPSGDQLIWWERRCVSLHLRCGVQGGVGRGGVNGVRSRDVQVLDGNRGVLDVPIGDQLGGGE